MAVFPMPPILRACFLLSILAAPAAPLPAEDAPAIDPDTRRVLEEADALAREKRWEEAIGLYRRAVGQNPELPYAHHQLGAALYAAGHAVEAAGSFAEATALSPDKAGYWHNLSLAQQAAGDLPKAIQAARRAADLEPGSRSEWLGDLYWEAEQAEEALRSFQQARALGAGGLALDAKIGSAAWMADRPEVAYEAWKRAGTDPDADSVLLFNLALAAEKLKKIPEAIDALDRLLAKSPGDFEARVFKAQLLVIDRRPRDAETAYRELLASNPSPESRRALTLELADLLYNQPGREGESVEWYRSLVESEPDNPEFRLRLASAFYFSGAKEKALPHYRKAVDAGHPDPVAHLALAQEALEGQRLDEARRLARKAVQQAPERKDAQFLLGRVAFAQEDFSAAQSAFEAAARLDPDDPETLYNLGLAQYRQGRNAEARVQLERFLRLAGERPELEAMRNRARSTLQRIPSDFPPPN